jgi:L-asparaginase II
VPPPPVVAEAVRSGFVESRHRGTIVGLHADGSAAFQLGEPDEPLYPRSANKPMQAVGMVRAGLRLPPELLALAAASHSGEPHHVDGVRAMLDGAGLDESDLLTPPDLPLDEDAATAWLRAGRDAASVTMNCSGKHAAMLATCVANGWATASYRDLDHPLQVAVQETVEQLAGEQVAATGVDGCGAPLFALSLTGLARAFRAIVLAPAGSAERQVADAMRKHPDYVGGTGRDVTALMQAVPGLLAKDGAEGVYAAAMPDGRTVALKIDDGAQRARAPVMVAALRRLEVDSPGLTEVAKVPLFGGGRVVGEVRAVS